MRRRYLGAALALALATALGVVALAPTAGAGTTRTYIVLYKQLAVAGDATAKIQAAGGTGSELPADRRDHRKVLERRVRRDDEEGSADPGRVRHRPVRHPGARPGPAWIRRHVGRPERDRHMGRQPVEPAVGHDPDPSTRRSRHQHGHRRAR